MPVAIFRTHRLAPRVVMANTNIMKATWPIFYDLQDKNLTMFAQYTAGPWEYIGTQGVIQGTFETLAAAGAQHFGGSLVGRIYFTAGLGGMGRNQPRAMTMHGGVCVVVDANPRIIRPGHRASASSTCEASSLEEAIRLAEDRQGRPPAAGHRRARQRGGRSSRRRWKWAGGPTSSSEMCPCHDPLSYIPAGYSPEEADALRRADRVAYLAQARESMKRQLARDERVLRPAA